MEWMDGWMGLVELKVLRYVSLEKKLSVRYSASDQQTLEKTMGVSAFALFISFTD